MRGKWGRRFLSYSESALSSRGCLYTFAALYIITNILLFLREAVAESIRHKDYRRYTTAIARGSGATINFNMAVVLLMSARSAIGLVRATRLNMVLPLDKAMPDFHRLVGITLVWSGLVHGIFHIPFYAIESPWSPGIKGTTSLFVTGIFIVALMSIIRLVAQPAVYHANYELFFRTHVACSVLLYGFIIIHGLHRGDYSTWKWVLAPVVIYSLDVLVRSFREKRSYLLVSKHSAALQSNNILKIRLPRVFHYEAGQYAEIKVPQLSRFQWHPFTIASAPHEPEIIFYIKTVGDWTRDLYQLFGERLSNDLANDIEVHLRGPYGAPAQHVGQFDRVILVGGGVGATPFCSVVKDVYNWIVNWTPHQYRTQRESDAKIGQMQEPQHINFDMQMRRSRSGFRASPGSTVKDASSHLFTTNVFSEHVPSTSSGGTHSIPDGIRFPDRIVDGNDLGVRSSTDIDATTTGDTTMHTARDFLSLVDRQSTSSSSPRSVEQRIERPKMEQETKRSNAGLQNNQLRGMNNIRMYRQKVRPHGMESNTTTTAGSARRSLDFLTALASLHEMEGADQLFHQSLAKMVTMSYGSTQLIRHLQLKQMQELQNARSSDLVGSERGVTPSTEAQVNLLRSRRVMLLLLMRSVTVNMVILWLLILRFTMAGAGYAFDVFQVFEEGIALYNITALSVLDSVLAFILMLMVGVPCMIEVIELKMMPSQGLDIFALLPMTIFEVIVGILGLIGVGRNVDELFGVFHVFVLWPVLTTLLGIRLLRVIGERIAQAENVDVSHTTTKSVDFFWTAPTAQDDQWLVGELQRFTDLREVRMHRYLTRAGGENEGGEERRYREDGATRQDTGVTTPGSRRRRSEPMRMGSLQTHFGRPQWEEIVNELAESCPNNSTIGVFFCGPHLMSEAVEQACTNAMRNSIIRGLQSSTSAMRGLEEIFGNAVTANEYTGDDVTKPAHAATWPDRHTFRASPSHMGPGAEGADRRARTIVAGRISDDGARFGCNITIVFKRESFL